MNKAEKLRLKIAEFVDFQVIRDDYVAEVPRECAVMQIISKDRSAYSGKRIIEKTDEYIIEQTARRVEAYLQFDCYAKTQERSEEMSDILLNKIIYENRYDLIRAGFGLSSDDMTVTDRTFLENKTYVYRFGFDIQMNWRELSERKRMLMKDVKVEVKEQN